MRSKNSQYWLVPQKYCFLQNLQTFINNLLSIILIKLLCYTTWLIKTKNLNKSKKLMTRLKNLRECLKKKYYLFYLISERKSLLKQIYLTKSWKAWLVRKINKNNYNLLFFIYKNSFPRNWIIIFIIRNCLQLLIYSSNEESIIKN